MRMGELERRTGVHREVIRVFLKEGLLPEPERPSRNSAIYSEAHVAGIAAVRALQRSRMTLKEIKAALDGNMLQTGGRVSDFNGLGSLLAARFGVDAVPNVSLQSLASRMAYATQDAAVFADMGMLRLVGQNGNSVSYEDARLIEIWALIREAGFAEETGYPPSNIGFYLEAAKWVARREAEVFFGTRNLPFSAEQAVSMLHTALPLMHEFFGILRFKAFVEEAEKLGRDG